MKHINYFVNLLFLISCTSFCVIDELSQFQQSLQKIPPFLSATKTKPIKPPPSDDPTKKPEITTYEALKTAVDTAYKAKNPSLLDDYNQTRIVVTAKVLLEEVIKNPSRYQPQHIAFIADIASRVEKTYSSPPNEPLHCVCLDRTNMSKDLLLGNELLLILALRSAGFSKIRLIPMNLWYDSDTKEYLKNTFNNLCNAHKIPLATASSEKGVALNLYDDAYAYIKNVIDGNLQKNHLFVMIGSQNEIELKVKKDQLNNVIDKLYDFSGDRFLNPVNELQFHVVSESNEGNYNIYVPYNTMESFLNYDITFFSFEKKRDINTEALNIARKNNPHKDIMVELSKALFSSLNAEYVNIIKNIDLFFYDLIINTTIKPGDSRYILAFRSIQADPEMTQITNITGTMEEIYNRYHRYKR